MKNRKKLGIAIMCVILLHGCQKELKGNRLILFAEGYGENSKMIVDGNGFLWAQDDEIRLNGQTYWVDVEDGIPSISHSVQLATPYRAFYPSSLNPTAELDDDVVDLNFPAVYNYSTDGAQDLEVPMAVKSFGGERLFFRHLTGALNVQVKNTFGVSIILDSIVVTSNLYQISGARDITLAEDISVSCTIAANDTQKRVVMRFPHQSSYTANQATIPIDGTKIFQIPVLPVGSNNKFTVTVAAHNVADEAMQFTFTRTQTEGGALMRKELGYVPVKFGGFFSVSASQQVRFSPGNLRYTPNPNASHYTATGIMSGAWTFASNQYDIIGNGNINYAQNGWIDLFGWGTSGWNSGATAYLPNSTSMTDADYYVGGAYSNSLTGSYIYADWAYFNAIRNGGQSARVWRTLTIDEWEYLFTTRTNAEQLYGTATIDGQYYGLVILPDDWPAVSGIAFNSGANGFSANNYTLEEWEQMEAFGAVFLPSAGMRLGSNQYYDACCYWSSTACHENYLKEKAYRINLIGGSYFTIRSADERMVGYAVRPVRNR